MQLRPLDWEGAVCSTSLAINPKKSPVNDVLENSFKKKNGQKTT